QILPAGSNQGQRCGRLAASGGSQQQVPGILICATRGVKLKITEAVHQKKKRREEKELLEAEGLARPRIGATTTERGGPYVQFQIVEFLDFGFNEKFLPFLGHRNLLGFAVCVSHIKV